MVKIKTSKKNAASDSQFADNKSAFARTRLIRSSPRKVSQVADMIRKMRASDALIQLKFCKKKVAQDLEKCLGSAIANAEHNFGLDIDSLWITEIMVGKSILMKRTMPRAKGRATRINKFFSNVKLTVTEMEE